MTIDRIRGLKFVIPGSILMPNDAPATIDVRQRPGKSSRARRPDHWVRAMRRALLLSFSGSGGLLAEIRVMSWLHCLLPQCRVANSINQTDNNAHINRFTRLIIKGAVIHQFRRSEPHK